MIYITGDKHRNFNEIKKFCKENNTTKDDVIIILGDVGLNFFGGIKDWSKKHSVAKLQITLFCVHGNHEQRPFAISTYREVEKFGAKVYMEEEFDNIVFAKDGEIYNFDGLKCMAIGGAYIQINTIGLQIIGNGLVMNNLMIELKSMLKIN